MDPQKSSGFRVLSFGYPLIYLNESYAGTGSEMLLKTDGWEPSMSGGPKQKSPKVPTVEPEGLGKWT